MAFRFRHWARGRLDITWRDLLFAAIAPALPRRDKVTVWPTRRPHLAAWSVRTAWDAVLAVQDWPSGTEIIVSEANIPAMIRLIELREWVAIPARVEPRTLSVNAPEIESLITARTRAILVAHLFGSRMALDEIAEVARRRGLLLVEDCAQSYAGTGDCGHEKADVSLFSFGLIKTQTALGGAVMFVRNEDLQHKIERHLARHPPVSLSAYYRRWARAMALKAASQPQLYGLLWRLLMRLKRDPDKCISSLSRGFAPDDFLRQIRQRPHRATLVLLRQRLRCDFGHRLACRSRCGREMAQVLGASVLGCDAPNHTFWAFPVRVSDREACCVRWQNAGFDASVRVSSVASCSASPTPFSLALEDAVFLPIYPEMPLSERRRLLDLVQRD